MAIIWLLIMVFFSSNSFGAAHPIVPATAPATQSFSTYVALHGNPISSSGRSLRLVNQNLTDLDGMENLPRIDELAIIDISGNRLKKITQGLVNKLTNLATLNISNNQLTELPDDIDDIISLDSIDLSNNKLTQLPSTIANIKTLTRIDLTNNPIPGTTSNIRDTYFANRTRIVTPGITITRAFSPITVTFKTPAVEQLERDLFTAIRQGKPATVTSLARQITQQTVWMLDNLRDEQGNTPLLAALSIRDKQFVKDRDPDFQGVRALLNFGSSPNVQNFNGQTAFHFAARDQRIMNLLRQIPAQD